VENRRNFYRVLQVQPGAPAEIIRASYRTLMQRLKAHPDLGGDHRTAALINEAYAVLADPVKRAAYDLEVRSRLETARTEHASPAPEVRVTDTCLFCGTAHPVARRDSLCTACRSPLGPATALKLAAAGQRAVERLPRNHPLLIWSHWPQPRGMAAQTRDVSPNGLSFSTGTRLEVGALVKIESELCHAVVEVTHALEDDGAWLVGAAFRSVLFARSRGGFLSARA
jgi:hypothetical protein